MYRRTNAKDQHLYLRANHLHGRPPLSKIQVASLLLGFVCYSEFKLHDFIPDFPLADSWRSQTKAPDQRWNGARSCECVNFQRWDMRDAQTFERQVKYLDLSASTNPAVWNLFWPAMTTNSDDLKPMRAQDTGRRKYQGEESRWNVL